MPPHAAAADARLGGRGLLLRRGVCGSSQKRSAISVCCGRDARVTTAFGKRRPAILIVFLTRVTGKDMGQAGDPGQPRGDGVKS